MDTSSTSMYRFLYNGSTYSARIPSLKFFTTGGSFSRVANFNEAEIRESPQRGGFHIISPLKVREKNRPRSHIKKDNLTFAAKFFYFLLRHHLHPTVVDNILT